MVLKDRNISYSMCDGCLDDNVVWFSDNSFNGVCRLDLDTLEVECVARFSGKQIWRNLLHRNAINYKDRVYFIMNEGDKIDVFYKDGFMTEEVSIPDKYLHKGKYSVAQSFLVGDQIWMFPIHGIQPVLIYDVLLQEFRDNAVLGDALKQYSGTILTYDSVSLYQDSFWMVILNTNNILEYNIVENRVRKIFFQESGLYSVKKIENNLWISKFRGSELYKWNLVTKEICVYCFDLLYGSFVAPYVLNNDIFILQKTDFFDVENQCVIGKLKRGEQVITLGIPSLKVLEYKNKIFIMPHCMECFLIIDIKNECIEKFYRTCKIMADTPENYREKIRYLEDKMSTDSIMDEDNVMDLDVLLGCLTRL